MDKTTRKWIDIVISSVQEIQKDFNNNKGLLLTEGDLECILYNKLISNKEFVSNKKCKSSDWKTGFVHSQVTWFKPDKDSGFEIDLTLLNPESLDIQTFEEVQNFPNKGFFYDGEAVAIELKFIRSDINKKVSNDAQCDYIKIVDRLHTSIELLIKKNRYSRANIDNIGFITVVACKTDEIYNLAIQKLKSAIKKRPRPDNVFPIIFSHNHFTNLVK